MMGKAAPSDFLGRFREVISDPLNLLIERVPAAGFVEGDLVYLHNGLRVPVAGPGAYYGPFSQVLVLNRGVHEPLEEYVFQQVLKRLPDGPSMIELGALVLQTLKENAGNVVFRAESIRGQGTWFTLTLDAAPGARPN